MQLPPPFRPPLHVIYPPSSRPRHHLPLPPPSPPPLPSSPQVLLQQAADFYREAPQRLLMVVDRLMALGLLAPPQLADWALLEAKSHSETGSEGRSETGSGGGSKAALVSSSPWEALYYGLGRAYRRRPQLAERLARHEGEVAALRARAAAAADRAAAEGEAMPAPTAGVWCVWLGAALRARVVGRGRGEACDGIKRVDMSRGGRDGAPCLRQPWVTRRMGERGVAPS